MAKNNFRYTKQVVWEKVYKSQENGLFNETTSNGLSYWFFVTDEYIWHLHTNSSDGGVWATDWILVEVSKSPFKQEMNTYIRSISDLYLGIQRYENQG